MVQLRQLLVLPIHVVRAMVSDTGSIPIGVPLPNYRCLIVDEFLQRITIGQEGELLRWRCRCVCWLSWTS